MHRTMDTEWDDKDKMAVPHVVSLILRNVQGLEGMYSVDCW